MPAGELFGFEDAAGVFTVTLRLDCPWMMQLPAAAAGGGEGGGPRLSLNLTQVGSELGG